jgi:outer membrane protein OmpA-like peptidoglycan-associated protein
MLIFGALAALAATTPSHAADTPDAAKAPDKLVILFDAGSAKVREADIATLDHASRLYQAGKPIVMVVSGSSDSVGDPDRNLNLSQRRAMAVLHGLVARGIPEERFQVVSKGATDLPVATPVGTAEPQNRRVEISWR